MRLSVFNVVGLAFVSMMLLLSACDSSISKDKAFIINGNIQNAISGTVTLAKLDLETNERVNVDSTEIIDGQFTFKGVVDAPYLHSLILGKDTMTIHFFLENSTIRIHGEAGKLETVQVSGSREDSLYRSLNFDDIFERKEGMDLMMKYPDYSFATFAAYYQFQIFNISGDTMQLLIDRFEKGQGKTTYFKYLNNLYETMKNVAIGSTAPDFAIPDTSDIVVSLSDFKGQYVLLDFWASWCAPCRAANPALVDIYTAYRGEDFTIVGISFDKKGDLWKNAIKNDGLDWTNLSNLKGWDEVSELYGVRAVPQNFLIDPQGIIIGKNLEPDGLKKQLEEIF